MLLDYWLSATLMDECSASPASLSERVRVCRRGRLCLASDRVRVGTKWGVKGQSLAPSFRLRCVTRLCWINHLPSAGVKVWLRSEGRQQQRALFWGKVLRLLCLPRHRHKDTRTHKAWWGLIWRPQAEVTAGRLPLM